jgi:methionyl-tRNA formyltransferase
VVLLTTDTTHHLYYAWRLREAGALDAVLVQTAAPRFPFPTEHAFERARDDFERETLLKAAPARLQDLVPVYEVATPNEPAALSALRQLKPDLILVFGTGVIDASVSGLPTLACLNLHGGNPEAYRGLDSHLWAVYHRDFGNVTTTLHHIAPGLDTGDVVLEARVPLAKGLQLHELRAANTKVCVDLSLTAVKIARDGLPLPSRPQRHKGRYYSAMPSVLKDVCVTAFGRHTAAL